MSSHDLYFRRYKMKGRPREFEIDRALESAMFVFWRNGYEGTSLTDLTSAMNINRPSLYAAFGDKESLFFKVLDRYLEEFGARGVEALSEHGEIRDAIAAFLNCVVELLTDSRLPPGCLIANSTLECGGKRYEAIGRRLSQCHTATEAALYQRLKLAQVQKQLPEGEDIQALAHFFTATMLGMGAIVRTNAAAEMMQQLAKTALRVLPTVSG
jgi:AcrR family transcriptional regulator